MHLPSSQSRGPASSQEVQNCAHAGISLASLGKDGFGSCWIALLPLRSPGCREAVHVNSLATLIPTVCNLAKQISLPSATESWARSKLAMAGFAAKALPRSHCASAGNPHEEVLSFILKGFCAVTYTMYVDGV